MHREISSNCQIAPVSGYCSKNSPDKRVAGRLFDLVTLVRLLEWIEILNAAARLFPFLCTVCLKIAAHCTFLAIEMSKDGCVHERTYEVFLSSTSMF